jgi:ADP-heptose:LPS heptosyltransferase
VRISGGDLLTFLRRKIREELLWFGIFVISPIILRAQVQLARLLARFWLHIHVIEPFDLSRTQRILVVRLDAIGDVVMTTPFLRELRRNLPDARITLVVNPNTYDLVRTCPYVDEIFSFDCLVPYRWSALLLPWRALKMARAHLWQQQFDLALLPRREFDIWAASFLVFFSRARWRVAYSEFVSSRKHRQNPGLDRLFTHLVSDQPGSMHEVDHNLNMLRSLGATIHQDHTELWTSPECDSEVHQLFRSNGVEDGDLLIGLCPGASDILKQWPAERFSEVAMRLIHHYNCKIVVLGGPADYLMGSTIAPASGRSVVNLAGVTSLPQTVAIIRRCQLFITNDTGPMHIAAAVGTKVIAIFGSSCEHRFGPWKVGNVISTNLACRPCNRGHVLDRCERCIYDEPRCLLDLSVDTVFRQADQVLNGSLSTISSA